MVRKQARMSANKSSFFEMPGSRNDTPTPEFACLRFAGKNPGSRWRMSTDRPFVD
jgi:hypothetical protein